MSLAPDQASQWNGNAPRIWSMIALFLPYNDQGTTKIIPVYHCFVKKFLWGGFGPCHNMRAVQTKIPEKMANSHLPNQRKPPLMFYESPASNRITKSTSLFSSSCMICRYVFCVVLMLECPSLLATLAIDTPVNNKRDACVCLNP